MSVRNVAGDVAGLIISLQGTIAQEDGRQFSLVFFIRGTAETKVNQRALSS
jgi:hypothetical protein